MKTFLERFYLFCVIFTMLLAGYYTYESQLSYSSGNNDVYNNIASLFMSLSLCAIFFLTFIKEFKEVQKEAKEIRLPFSVIGLFIVLVLFAIFSIGNYQFIIFQNGLGFGKILLWQGISLFLCVSLCIIVFRAIVKNRKYF